MKDETKEEYEYRYWHGGAAGIRIVGLDIPAVNEPNVPLTRTKDDHLTRKEGE